MKLSPLRSDREEPSHDPTPTPDHLSPDLEADTDAEAPDPLTTHPWHRADKGIEQYASQLLDVPEQGQTSHLSDFDQQLRRVLKLRIGAEGFIREILADESGTVAASLLVITQTYIAVCRRSIAQDQQGALTRAQVELFDSLSATLSDLESLQL